MQIQFNSDNQTPSETIATDEMEALVESRLSRISDRLTRVEVHVADVNGPRGGADDKRCTIEIRPNGMDPISATDHAGTIERAVAGAAAKVVTAFDRQIGKTTNRKGH